VFELQSWYDIFYSDDETLLCMCSQQLVWLFNLSKTLVDFQN
jgi:hypothetical protein